MKIVNLSIVHKDIWTKSFECKEKNIKDFLKKALNDNIDFIDNKIKYLFDIKPSKNVYFIILDSNYKLLKLNSKVPNKIMLIAVSIDTLILQEKKYDYLNDIEILNRYLFFQDDFDIEDNFISEEIVNKIIKPSIIKVKEKKETKKIEKKILNPKKIKKIKIFSVVKKIKNKIKIIKPKKVIVIKPINKKKKTPKSIDTKKVINSNIKTNKEKKIETAKKVKPKKIEVIVTLKKAKNKVVTLVSLPKNEEKKEEKKEPSILVTPKKKKELPKIKEKKNTDTKVKSKKVIEEKSTISIGSRINKKNVDKIKKKNDEIKVRVPKKVTKEEKIEPQIKPVNNFSSVNNNTSNTNVQQQNNEVQNITYTILSPDNEVLYYKEFISTKPISVEELLLKTGLDINNSNGFIESINGISNEGMSGWVFEVNNVPVMISAEDYIVNPNEQITWKYVDFSKLNVEEKQTNIVDSEKVKKKEKLKMKE